MAGGPDEAEDEARARLAELEEKHAALQQKHAALEEKHARVEQRIEEISDTLVRIAAGDLSARASRSNDHETLDLLAFMVNSTALELESVAVEREAERKRQRAIVESMLDGLLVVGPSCIIKQVNSAVTRLLGYTVREISGLELREIMAESQVGTVTRALEALTPSAPLRSFELTLRAKDGTYVPLVANATLSEEGKGAVLVLHDERELRAARAQLHIADRMAVMGTVAAGVAHEINNPLMYVQTNLEFVADELAVSDLDGREELLRALADSVSGAQRIRDIVRELKVFSRGDDETVTNVDVNAVLDSALQMLRNELRHAARVVRDYTDIPPVVANAGRLGQVFLNLVHNAAQAIPEGSADMNEIRLTTRVQGGMVTIDVSDTGLGIPPDVLPRIFDAFFTTKPLGIGTGLGLSICQKVIASAGGTIDVKSALGSGTTFRVSLPIAEDYEGAGPVNSEAPRSGPRGGRILVVDDEPAIARALKRVFVPRHEVVSFEDARDALRLLASESFDVILCDVMMPRMNGLAFYSAVLAAYPDQAARFVFMTGGTFTAESRAFLEHVDRPRLDKPFRRDDVIDVVGRVLAEHGLEKAC